MMNIQKQIHFWTHMLDEAFCKETDWNSVSKDYFGRKNKQDEWYTSPENAKLIIEPFKKHLHGKKVYCNCDDPEQSGVYQVLYSNFKSWGLAKLVSTGYGAKYKAVVTLENYDDPSQILQEAPGNGDMNSEDSLKEASEADVIVSNPPFSRPEEADDNLFRNWVMIGFQCKCDLIGIGMTRSVKEKFISQKIMQGQLFAYYCPRYKFSRSGKNLENMDGQVKDTVQVSIYSTFDERLEYGPKLKFNQQSYLQSLPTVDWNGQKVSITVNDQHFTSSTGKMIKDGAFSRSIIPPPTEQNLTQLVAVPFNVIDLNWRDWFILRGFIDTPKVVLSNGEKKTTSPAIVLQYNVAAFQNQENASFSSIKDLDSSNIDQFLRKTRLEVDKLFAAEDIDRLKYLRTKYYQNRRYSEKTGNILRASFFKQVQSYVADAIKLLTGQMSTVNDFIKYTKWIYNTTTLSFEQKLTSISKVLNRLKMRRFYVNNPDKDLDRVGQNFTREDIERLTVFIHLMSSCLKFNQRYAEANSLFKKSKKDLDVVPQALNLVRSLQKQYETNIKPHLDNPDIDQNTKTELRYKIQRMQDQVASIKTNYHFKTVNNYASRFASIIGCRPDEFDASKIFSKIDHSQLESIDIALSKLRPPIGMYIKFLKDNRDDYIPEIYEKIMQKALEVKDAVSAATKECHRLMKNK